MAKCENECYKLIRALPIVAENWMRKPLVIQLALLLIAAAIFVLGSPLDASAGKKCITIGDKRICFEDGKDKSNDDADNAKSQKTCAKKKISCPAGYVVLDKPNKYGACCEPKEGLPPTPIEQKCKFPGSQVGTPPNCTCPDGTEFLGFKGCIKFTTQSYCSDNNKPGDRLLNSTELTPFSDKCKAMPYNGTPSCAGPFATTGPGLYRCCCYYRVYAQ